MRLVAMLVLLLPLGSCEADDDPPAAETGAVGTTGEAGPWWLGAFHDAGVPVGSNATLITVGNLELREDGTATGTTRFCDDEPELAEYTWTQSGDTIELAGDPLIWQGGEIAAITITRGTGCDEIQVSVATLADTTVDATYARGATCLESTGPSCAVSVVWCGQEPDACS